MAKTKSSQNQIHSVDLLLKSTTKDIALTLDKVLVGQEVSPEEGARLFDATGTDLLALMATADELRCRSIGDEVTYVVNRNINFTNVCIKRCGFCAFSRDHRTEEGYWLPVEEIVRRAKEAVSFGATEVCIQAGLPPKMKGSLYGDITRSIKKSLPELHIHGFSPEEVLYGSIRSKSSIRDQLLDLKDAGVGSLPGTSAEILDDNIRKRISPGRITKDQWLEVITNAHDLGIPTTATIMYGHVESAMDRTRHLALIRDIQKSTGGFTEFVPLGFIHSEAPMYIKQFIDELREGPTGMEVVKMHAISRIMLDGYINNIQVSWVKEGHKLGQVLLQAGANDMGGTLINESISTAAGAAHGQLVAPRMLRNIIWDAGRIPVERTTLYQIRKVFDKDLDSNFVDPLDTVDPGAAQFGSYKELIQLKKFRFDEVRKLPLEQS